jgi:hypothetical protein
MRIVIHNHRAGDDNASSLAAETFSRLAGVNVARCPSQRTKLRRRRNIDAIMCLDISALALDAVPAMEQSPMMIGLRL